MRTTILIRTRADGKYDFRVMAAENNSILCSSDQGYENLSDCLATAKRVVSAGANAPVTFTEETR